MTVFDDVHEIIAAKIYNRLHPAYHTKCRGYWVEKDGKLRDGNIHWHKCAYCGRVFECNEGHPVEVKPDVFTVNCIVDIGPWLIWEQGKKIMGRT